jgi:PAP2 superfamily
MTTAAAASIPARAAGRLSRWLSVRHPLHTEAAVVLALYGLYEGARGLVVGNAAEAERHALRLAATERSLHLLLEVKLQSAVHMLPGLTSLLAAAYVTLHVTVTAAVLLWLHQRRPAAFPFVRTMLLLASALSLIGFLAYPAAPPRLAGIGIADTASHGPIDLRHDPAGRPSATTRSGSEDRSAAEDLKRDLWVRVTRVCRCEPTPHRQTLGSHRRWESPSRGRDRDG